MPRRAALRRAAPRRAAPRSAAGAGLRRLCPAGPPLTAHALTPHPPLPHHPPLHRRPPHATNPLATDPAQARGDFEGSVAQYARTIGSVEPSYVIRRFLDSTRIANLTGYLEALHREGRAAADHTTLLLNCE